MGARLIFIFAVGYTLLITTLSLVQLGKISVGSFNPTDKMMHTAAYFGLAFCWLFYFFIKKPDSYNLKRGFVKVSALVVLFGMLIEVLQGAITTYREPDWADIVANTIGVLIALGFFILFRNFLNHVKRQISSFL
ncbi:MAG: VanZ family protein [Gillisia sp.]